jgi:hypothetical protein
MGKLESTDFFQLENFIAKKDGVFIYSISETNIENVIF